MKNPYHIINEKVSMETSRKSALSATREFKWFFRLRPENDPQLKQSLQFQKLKQDKTVSQAIIQNVWWNFFIIIFYENFMRIA